MCYISRSFFTLIELISMFDTYGACLYGKMSGYVFILLLAVLPPLLALFSQWLDYCCCCCCSFIACLLTCYNLLMPPESRVEWNKALYFVGDILRMVYMGKLRTVNLYNIGWMDGCVPYTNIDDSDSRKEANNTCSKGAKWVWGRIGLRGISFILYCCFGCKQYFYCTKVFCFGLQLW